MRRPVFIVEDDFDVRELFADTLTEAGYDVGTASNGVEALSRLRGREPPPGVILLDLMMPIMDGWQLKRELANDPVLNLIPVVMMTASRNLGPAIGGDVLLKPFPIDALLATVERHCGGA
jgi:DNA-binding response OmpR family regulator